MANARNSAKNAVAKAQAKAPAKTETKAPAKVETPETEAAFDPKVFLFKECTVMKGSKYKGETLGVFFVSKGNQYRKPVARAERTTDKGVEIVWIKPEYLEIKGDMSEKDIKRLKAQQDAEQHETLYVAANVITQSDSGVTIKAKGWLKRLFFTTTNDTREGMLTTTDCVDAEGTDIFEIVAWKVKKDLGMDSYNALKAMQPELAKIVEKK